MKIKDITTRKKGNYDRRAIKLDGDYPFYVSGRKVERSDKHSIDGDNIFIGRIGGIGEKIVHYNDCKCDASKSVHILTVKKEYKEKILTKYLYYYIRSNFAQRVLGTGATIKTLPIFSFDEIEIELISIDKQKEIISKLDKFESIKENLLNIKNELSIKADNLLKSKLIESFSNEFVKQKLLIDIVNVQNGKNYSKDKIDKGTYNFYTYSKTVYKSNSYTFKGDDFITIPMKGHSITTENIHIESNPFSAIKGILLINLLDKSEILPEFLSYQIKYLLTTKNLISGDQVINLDKDKLLKSWIKFIPIQEQLNIIKDLKKTEEIKNKIKDIADKLSILFEELRLARLTEAFKESE